MVWKTRGGCPSSSVNVYVVLIKCVVYMVVFIPPPFYYSLKT